MNSLIIDKEALEGARRQFCLDIGLPWEVYVQDPCRRVYIQKAVYRDGTLKNRTEGAREYEGRTDFFHAMICLGQLFLIVDEKIYDWAQETYGEYSVEWFCEYSNLRKIDDKLKEFGHRIKDTHVYYLPEAVEKSKTTGTSEQNFQWYDREEILRFQGNNRFTSAVCFSKTQPDMLAVAIYKAGVTDEPKTFDQSKMEGMAGVSADGKYLWQIGINVTPEAAGKGLGHRLVRSLKERVQDAGKIPFYGTSESHCVSQTVGLKAGFVPAWTEVYAESVSGEV